MATVILDRDEAERIRRQRVLAGSDRWDEVWEGTYMMTPLPNDQHQQLVNLLATIYQEVLGWSGEAEVRPGINVSDREDDWTQNYRCPDVAVFLKDGAAKNCDTFWLGGPDFAVEIASPDDLARDKIPFYAKVGTHELLIIDRDPWQIELFHLEGEVLRSVGISTLVESELIASDVLPFTYRLVGADDRPHIAVVHTATGKEWLI